MRWRNRISIMTTWLPMLTVEHEVNREGWRSNIIKDSKGSIWSEHLRQVCRIITARLHKTFSLPCRW